MSFENRIDAIQQKALAQLQNTARSATPDYENTKTYIQYAVRKNGHVVVTKDQIEATVLYDMASPGATIDTRKLTATLTVGKWDSETDVENEGQEKEAPKTEPKFHKGDRVRVKAKYPTHHGQTGIVKTLSDEFLYGVALENEASRILHFVTDELEFELADWEKEILNPEPKPKEPKFKIGDRIEWRAPWNREPRQANIREVTNYDDGSTYYSTDEFGGCAHGYVTRKIEQVSHKFKIGDRVNIVAPSGISGAGQQGTVREYADKEISQYDYRVQPDSGHAVPYYESELEAVGPKFKEGEVVEHTYSGTVARVKEVQLDEGGYLYRIGGNTFYPESALSKWE